MHAFFVAATLGSFAGSFAVAICGLLVVRYILMQRSGE